MDSKQPIGIFDSGVGGLTVVKAIESILPHEHLIYIGDTQHMPYGDKSAENIQLYCDRIVAFFLTKNVKLIVIACNTASAHAASFLRAKYWQQVEIKGVIRPAIKSIIAQNFKKVGIIGTQGTIQSNIFQTLFDEYKASTTLFQLATPLLAPMIEQGLYNTDVSKSILKNYLSNPGFNDAEAILLACTHYPLIKNEIQDYFNNSKIILDNAKPMAQTVYNFLIEKGLLATQKCANSEFFVTEYTKEFEQAATLFHGEQIKIEEINLNKF